MRKTFLLMLVFLLLGLFLLADDAMVMPKRVGRFYLAPTFISANETFDNVGKRHNADNLSMFNLGAALEHGLNDWITFALQWAPGINLWSELDMEDPFKAELAGMGDLVIGAKVQILGRAAPIRSENMRLAFAPGIWVPLSSGPDFEKELEKMSKGETFTPSNLDNHVLGFGIRSYFDYIFNENFFVNFYNEFSLYPFKRDIKKLGLYEYSVLQQLNHLVFPSNDIDATVSGEGSFQYDMTFEIEPRYTRPLIPGTILEVGLPIVYQNVPEMKYDISGSGVDADIAASIAETYFESTNNQSHLLSVNPGVAVFFMNWGMPIQFKLTYSVPVWGENVYANRVLGLQARFYYRI